VRAFGLSFDHVTLTGNAGAPALATAELVTNRSVAVPGDAVAVCAAGVVVVSSSYNTFADASCPLAGAGDRNATDPGPLGPLGDNGGPVPTRVPEPGGDLVDRVPPSACPVGRDSRAVNRPQGAGCDIGAVEVSS
jgi:hypothetical protein